MKDKRVLFVGIALVLFVVIGGGFFLLSTRKSQSTQTSTDTQQEDVVQTINPNDLGLVITVRDDKARPAVKFAFTKVQDVQSIEYELNYKHDVKGQQIGEQLQGTAVKLPNNSLGIVDYRIFGTASSGVERYDVGITSPKLIFKIVKKNGQVFQAETDVVLK